MAMFILLTAGQAEHVRGPSGVSPSAALDPVERQGGLFVLGIDVLGDPAHVTHRNFLSALPQLDSEDPSFPATIERSDT